MMIVGTVTLGIVRTITAVAMVIDGTVTAVTLVIVLLSQ